MIASWGFLSRAVAPYFLLLLLEDNADVNARNNDGETPLDLAKRRPLGNEEVLELLQQQSDGASPS